ncbi:MAG: maleate cis-trans isomerase family protein, partial [Gammaproteobacteria bacterium]
EVCAGEGRDTPIISSAGALISALKAFGAQRISFIAPYMKNLTRRVADYIEAEGIEVVDTVSLEIPDNLDVAAQDPMNLLEIVKRLDTRNVDAVVLSACVQMPSLGALHLVQESFDVPVLSSAAATVFEILRALSLPTNVPQAGDLLSGRY